MTEIFSFKAIIAAFLSVWARSAILFWSLAVCCLVVFIALVAGAHWQLGDAPVLLAAYGTILVLTFLVLFVLAAFTTYSERPPPTLSLLPQESQSFCGQSRQPDGRITTQLELRFQATNLTGGAILLSALELRRPFVRRRAVLAKIHDIKRPIEPYSLTYGSATIIIACPVGSVGKMMRVVVAVQDHAGRWHKIIFPHLPVSRTSA
jgi:hypothetical protein